jgi:NTP pyrophosphatase (non-canonical NTP hydrolase)
MSLPKSDSLNEIQTYINQTFSERWLDDETISQKFKLLMEECGEFAWAARKSAGVAVAGTKQVRNLQHEAAVVLIVFLGICNALDIDANAGVCSKGKNNTINWS